MFLSSSTSAILAMLSQPGSGTVQYKDTGSKSKLPMSDAVKTCDLPRFQTAVPFCARCRLGYPQRLIARVIDIVGLKPGDNVMDLGCGPGRSQFRSRRRQCG